MPISSETFGEGMKRLRNAFNRTISDKVIDGWFQEIKDGEENIFTATIKALIREDHYPNLGQFWARYHECEHRFGVKEKDVHGCPKCRNGYIHFIQYSHKSGVKHEVMAFCKICWPEKTKYVVDSNRTFDYVPGMEPWKHRPDVQVPRPAIPGLLHGLHEKMADGATDWEKEDKEAWRIHDQAVEQHEAQGKDWTG